MLKNVGMYPQTSFKAPTLTTTLTVVINIDLLALSPNTQDESGFLLLYSTLRPLDCSSLGSFLKFLNSPTQANTDASSGRQPYRQTDK